ncbi:expressed unknown protein [Seminavis robusta]|uniref:Reverse transcriptase zinc-binding domain-containing protein n=1 Tax=Seminavis robusta TaxID=568900 RepID=A0A9N8DQK6_9STRA|nr:expressed unknown protein [Seminavis robusta]|eukprot:Sro300_g111791.1  (274) ;mRNA; r:66688-67509
MNKHEWDSNTFEDIDWKCHGRALNRLDHHRTSLTKYLCNWHPVGKRVNKYHPKYPIACASCGAPEENREHVLRCPKRQSERTAWKKALKQYTDKHNTHPMLQTLLLSALQKVLDGEDTTGIEYDDSVADIANAQAAIGWDQLLKGRLSKQWAQRQDQHLKECNLKTHRKNGQTWLTGIIQELLNQWFELWEARNHDRHGKDAQTKAQAANQQVIHELQLLYDKYTGNLRTEQAWLLQTPINTRSQWPTASIRQWINTWEPVLEESYATQLETG